MSDNLVNLKCTTKSEVNLKKTILDPPSTPVIYDGRGEKVESITKPYIEGDHLSFSCEVTKGKVNCLREIFAVFFSKSLIKVVNMAVRPNISLFRFC